MLKIPTFIHVISERVFEMLSKLNYMAHRSSAYYWRYTGYIDRKMNKKFKNSKLSCPRTLQRCNYLCRKFIRYNIIIHWIKHSTHRGWPYDQETSDSPCNYFSNLFLCGWYSTFQWFGKLRLKSFTRWSFTITWKKRVITVLKFTSLLWMRHLEILISWGSNHSSK